MADSSQRAERSAKDFPPRSAATAQRQAQPGHHGVKFYSSEADLARAAGPFLADGLSAGGPAAIVARRDNGEAILDFLRRTRLPVDDMRRDQALVFIELDQALESVSMAGRFDDAQCERFLTHIAEKLPAGASPERVRLYSELFSELRRTGAESDAARLERYWERRPMAARWSLTCGYPVAELRFETRAKSYLEVCGLHNAVQHEWDPYVVVRETKRDLRRLRELADRLEADPDDRADDAAGDEDDPIAALPRLETATPQVFDDSLTLVAGWGELLGRVDQAAAAGDTSLPPQARPASILVAAPLPAMRRMLVMRLEADGHRVIGCAAPEQVARHVDLLGRIDCLVADAAVAGAEPGLAAQLAGRFPDLAVLLLADRGRALEFRPEDLPGGRVEILEKPFSAAELARRVSALVRSA